VLTKGIEQPRQRVRQRPGAIGLVGRSQPSADGRASFAIENRSHFLTHDTFEGMAACLF
jgi:hypothetical protein